MLQIEIKKKGRFKTDLAPLIDVVFLLLIFFMLTFAVSGHGLDLTLPNGDSTENQDESLLAVVIDSEGVIKVGDEIIALEELTPYLRTELTKRSNKTVSIQVDDKTLYDLFVKLFDMARLAGAKDFSLNM